MIFNWRAILTVFTLLCSTTSYSAKLAIVIDDFGYRQYNEEQILKLPLPVTVAVLPDSPLRKEMIAKAKQQGREIIIHMPMKPVSRQPLEKNTLLPTMSEEEIEHHIEQAIAKVPEAKGINNHMGSAMTSDLQGMKHVINTLEKYNMFFLDSMTTSRTQSYKAAKGTNVIVLKRDVFLDDDISEAAVYRQFNLAIKTARRQGYAIVIGHPHTSTVNVLKRMLRELPPDIELVTLSSLLHASKSVAPVEPDNKSDSSESSALPTPQIVEIPLAPEALSSNVVYKIIEPCPITIPDDFEVPSQFLILIETINDTLITIRTGKKPNKKQEGENKGQAYLYIS